MKKNSLHKFLRNRELGFVKHFGVEEFLTTKLYTNFNKLECDQTSGVQTCENKRKYGGVFNLEFSLDGRLLVAACEEKSILLYDASNQRHIKTLVEAHTDCVNCVRFFDTYNFATCSDDNSIKLWDLRNLKRETRLLYGHSNWVKNIEYSEPENLMVTSAFDGSIYTWDIKDYSENNQPYNAVFLMNGIMRTKLSPGGTKMVISTTSGYMIIIHDLNLSTLANDLKSFKPNLYRLMQLTEQNFPAGSVYNYLFHPYRKKNRVEFIDDFPNRAEVISSLQIHPHGWNAVSRNINGDESEDWTSVHDIQTIDPSEAINYTYVTENVLSDGSDVNSSTRIPTDIWMGFITNEQYNYDRSSSSVGVVMPPMTSLNSGLIGRNAYKSFMQKYPQYQNKIVKNTPRLTHFIKEVNAGKGYIKEVCFSPDGRTICSPYNKGIRILGFNQNAQELPYCLSNKPTELCTLVDKSDCHKHVVVCCKFNPTHMQLVSGCLGGDIVWYEPFI